MVFVKLLHVPKPMQLLVLYSLGSCFPTWSAYGLDLLDDSMGLRQLASILVVKDPNANLPENAFVLVVPPVVSNGLCQCALVHCVSM